MTSARPTSVSLRWRATVSAFSRWDSQLARRAATFADRTRSPTTSGLRKFSCTNDPNVAPNWSLRSLMIAVCGMGSPSGCRNSAVTANQSASPPTSDPSSAARAYSNHVPSPASATAT
jgi:hypothetical protein